MPQLKQFLQKFYFGKRRPVMLWIDHSLGGGTASYSKAQFKKLGRRYDIKRLQYFPNEKVYKLTNISSLKNSYKTKNLNQLFDACKKCCPTEIVVNNLVGYASSIKMLRFISELKNNIFPKPTVSFRGHDFHCVCPSYNLINCDGAYCNLCHTDGCEECWKNKKLATTNCAHNILKSGATTVKQWRDEWGFFLENVVDNIVVFSDSTKEILIRIYPNISDKISVIPHTTQKYKRVKIKPHNDINIGVLGHISHAKGADIIHQISCNLSNYPNVNIIIIGTLNKHNDNVHIHGKYTPRQLPRIIQSKKIDLIFIPSIWPETFSYTTSEAMAMGVPVACYDMGAPAERVARYKYGLILHQISPCENLNEIIRFIQTIKGQ